MTTLTFCRTRSAIERRLRKIAISDPLPFVMTEAQDVKNTLKALNSGRDVIALADAGAFGWRAPKGTEVAFDDDMAPLVGSGLYEQCAARAAIPSGPVLTVCREQATIRSRLDTLDPADLKPFLLLEGASIPEAIDALKEGRDVYALAEAMATGWSAPAGVRLDLDPDMADAAPSEIGQMESRLHRIGRRPHLSFEIDAAETMRKLDAKRPVDDSPSMDPS